MPELLPQMTGPSRRPANGAAPKKLVVLLHGLGADGSDLIGLAPYWAALLPDAEFLSPDAPFPCDMGPYGRQWFSVQNRTPETALAGARAAAPILDAFLDDALAKRGLDGGELALVGFSQGAMMSLFVGFRRAKAPAAIVAYSGALIAPQLLGAEMRSKPPVLVIHGDADPVVPPSMLPAAVSALKANGVAVEELMRPGLGHSIDEEGLARGGAFLRDHFARAT
ncbi:MAG TPA: prolyl oligopeptidase family serine peptidase [Stellaceae bacterium]|nr:prolyl oligopeptidase family serine peptidase [Stellaceae bacterium]